MFKKGLLLLTILFFNCEDTKDNIPEQSIKMWLNGEEVNVKQTYKSITTYGSRDTYIDSIGSDGTWIVEQKTRKIFVIHFQAEDGRILAENEHYALIFVDWDAASFTSSLINEGIYTNPSSDDKEVLLQIVGPFDYTIGAEAEIINLQMLSSGQYVSGRVEGSFFNPFANAEVFGILEFENLHIDTDEENTIYSNLRRGSNGT
jgi:hypothetical protein